MKRLYNLWAKTLLYLSRGTKYVTILNTFMLVKIFWDTFDNKILALSLCVAGIIGLVILAWIDYKEILGLEQGLVFGKNPEWNEIRDELKEIRRMLNEKQT